MSSNNSTIEKLVEMGFSKERAELAISKTKCDDLQTCMDWLLSHNEEEVHTEQCERTNNTDQNIKDDNSSPATTPKSLRCDDCGKLFKTQEEVEFHASKSGHENFSESMEEKQPLTEEEKKEQLAKIEAKLRMRRLERESKEKEEALEKERIRIKSGKEMLEAKKKFDELEMKKIVEQRKREKEEDRLARQKVKEQIEQDKQARKAKSTGILEPEPELPKPLPSPAAAPKTPQNYSEVQLQIRLPNGSQLVQTFGAKEPLSAVKLYVEINRKDDNGSFSLMIPYPRKVFGPEDYEVPLESLGLGPRATLIVTKSNIC